MPVATTWRAQVRWEDQKQINEFGGLNQMRVELRAKRDAIKVRAGTGKGGVVLAARLGVQKQLTDLEDAEEALMLVQEDGEHPSIM